MARYTIFFTLTVLYFADTRFPIERANGAQTMATCQGLAMRHHDVTLVVRPDTATPARDPFEFYGLARTPRLTIETIPSAASRHVRRARFLIGAAARAAARSTAIVYTRDLGLAAFLMQLPLPRRPRLVYESHGIAPIVSAELPQLLGPPHVAPSASKLRRLDARERRVWRHAHAYVTITRALADDLEARYGPRSRVFVVPDGAPDAAIIDAPTAAATPLAAYAGHLYPWKGVDVFVRALALAPTVHGLIVGGHPGETDRQRVEALARELGVIDRLEITGLVAPRAVAPALARATMLVLPNTASTMSDRYTSPLKLFEYLGLRRPIVASDSTAIREVLTHEATALLVPPGDADALAAALTRLANDPALSKRLGDAAGALAPEYSWSRRADRLEAALAAGADA